MRLLSIETSCQEYSVALLENGRAMAHCSGPSRKTPEPHSGSSSRLAPSIYDLLKNVGWDMRDLTGLAVSVGPGSFTGLRVGMTTAKTLAYSLNLPICGVPTTAAVFRQTAKVYPEYVTIQVAINAQRQQLFIQKFKRSDENLPDQQGTIQLLGRDEWLSSLTPGEVVSGDGVKPLVSDLEARQIVVANESSWLPRAESVGLLAWERFESGDVDDLWKLQPHYFRPSAAEEKRQKSSI